MTIEACTRAEAALLSALQGIQKRVQGCERACRLAAIIDGVTPGLMERVKHSAKSDGGWANIPETLWCLTYLKRVGNTEELSAGLKWLGAQRLAQGGWGESHRDCPRIPTTALILHFLGDEIGSEADRECLRRLWAEDLESEVQLTYKGGFFLLCQAIKDSPDVELIEKTLQFLEVSQNEDGGFGPWKNHPIGSDPWSTGICLVGLCTHQHFAPRGVVERAADWLQRSQLSSGLWPYHFIDEGSAYALWGLRMATSTLGCC